MTGPAQTPTVFMNAAAAETLKSLKCVTALAACGYSPSDFGSYAEIYDRTGERAKKTDGVYVAGQNGQIDPEKDPKAHQDFLGSCQSGHISENCRHQGGKRGDEDKNYCPYYDSNEAPCMPHAGNAFNPKTQHGAVLTQDRQTRRDLRGDPGPGKKIGAERERGATRKAIDASLDWGMNDDQDVTQVAKDKRYAAIVALNSKDPKIAAAAKKSDAEFKKAIDAKYKENAKKAAECIESYVDAQWKAMAGKARDAKKDATDQAKAKAAASDAKVAALEGQKGKSAEKQLAQAREEQAAAHAEHAQAKQELKAAEDVDVDACRGEAQVKGKPLTPTAQDATQTENNTE